MAGSMRQRREAAREDAPAGVGEHGVSSGARPARATTSARVVRHDVYLKALESARKVLRLYHSERRRQL